MKKSLIGITLLRRKKELIDRDVFLDLSLGIFFMRTQIKIQEIESIHILEKKKNQSKYV